MRRPLVVCAAVALLGCPPGEEEHEGDCPIRLMSYALRVRRVKAD